MKTCRDQFQFKDDRLTCELERGHKGSHFNEKYGHWPNYHGRPKNMDEVINRALFFIGLCVAAAALLGLVVWLVERSQ